MDEFGMEDLVDCEEAHACEKKVLHVNLQVETTDAEVDIAAEPPVDTVNGDEAFEVEEIVGVRKQGKNVEYFVKWKGYSTEENSWEPRENILCKEMLAAFAKSKKGQQLLADCGLGKRGRPSTNSSTPCKPMTSDKIIVSSTTAHRRRCLSRASTPDFDEDLEAFALRKKKKAEVAAARATKVSRTRNDADTSFSNDDRGQPSDKFLCMLPEEGEAPNLDRTDYNALACIPVAVVARRCDIKKSDNPLNDADPISTRDYGGWRQSSISDGVRCGFVLRHIIAVLHAAGKLVYLVDWKQDSKNIDVVEHGFLVEFYPSELLAFYMMRAEIQDADQLTERTSPQNAYVNGVSAADNVDAGDRLIAKTE